MIEMLHYIRFRQTGEVSGFRPGRIDRFAAASITLALPQRKRPPGVPANACHLAGVICPKYCNTAAAFLPDVSPITQRSYFAETAPKEGRKEGGKEVRKKGGKEERR
jgi:hypothetical protein